MSVEPHHIYNIDVFKLWIITQIHWLGNILRNWLNGCPSDSSNIASMYNTYKEVF